MAKKEARSKKPDQDFISGKISKIVNRNLDAYCAIAGSDKGDALEEAIVYFLQSKGLEPYKAPTGITYTGTGESSEHSS